MGIVGSPTSPAYSAAKGAIAIFTKSAALQYAKENIRINSVHPGYADTPLTEKRFSDPAARQQLLDRTPMGRLGIANGVLFWRPTNHPGSPTRSWSSIGVPAQ